VPEHCASEKKRSPTRIMKRGDHQGLHGKESGFAGVPIFEIFFLPKTGREVENRGPRMARKKNRTDTNQKKSGWGGGGPPRTFEARRRNREGSICPETEKHLRGLVRLREMRI